MVEVALIMLVIIVAFSDQLGVGVSENVLMVSMMLLAVFYFISAYFIPELQGMLAVVSAKVVSISSAICVIGLLFAILKLTGADQMLMIGTLSIFIAGIFLLVHAIKSWSKEYVPLFLRVLILGTLSGTALMKLMENSGQQ
jgi:hypothetical protein